MNAEPDAMARLRARLRAANPGAPSYDHLFAADLIQRLTPTDVIIDCDEDAEPVEPVKRTRQRKLSPASAARQMKRAGFDIAGCEINPRDGTFKVIFGKPVDTSHTDIDDPASPIDRSEWN